MINRRRRLLRAPYELSSLRHEDLKLLSYVLAVELTRIPEVEDFERRAKLGLCWIWQAQSG